MVESLGWAELEVRPSFGSRFDRDLESGTSRAFSAAGASGGARFGDSAGRSMTSRFSHHAATAAKVAAGALAVAGFAAFQIGQDSLAEAREAQKIGAITASTIRSTGGAANVTRHEIEDLATAISLKTGIDDEAIQAGENMILSFKNIRNEAGATNDIFDQTTQAVTDMAAFMAQSKGGEVDLKSASIQVGKALNDPIKGLTALGKVGVAFTDGQKEQITTLVESGKRLDAQKIILGELQSEFGGAAEAGATWGEKTKTAIGNVKEKFGTALLPLVDDVERAFVKKGVPAITGWVDAFEDKGIPAIKHWAGIIRDDGIPMVKDFIAKTKPLAEEVLPALGSVLGTTRDVLKEAAPYAADLVGAFNDMPDWAKKGLALGGLAGVAGAKLGLGSILKGAAGGGGVLGGISKAAPLPVYVVNNGLDVPGGGGAGGGGKIPAVLGGKPLGSLPTLAPLIPIGLSSAPGQTSLLDTVRGQKQGPMPGALPDPKGLLDDIASVDATTQKLLDNWRTGSADFQSKIADDESRFGKLIENYNDGSDRFRKHLQAVATTKVDPKFTTPGLPESKRNSLDLLGLLGQVEKPRRAKVSADTANAQAAIDHIAATLAALHDKNIHVRVFTDQGMGPVGDSGTGNQPSTPRTSGKDASLPSSGRPVQVNVHLDGERVGEFVDSRIFAHADLADEAERAGKP